MKTKKIKQPNIPEPKIKYNPEETQEPYESKRSKGEKNEPKSNNE